MTEMTGSELAFFSTETETSEILYSIGREFEMRCVGLAGFPFDLMSCCGSESVCEFLGKLPFFGEQRILFLHFDDFDLKYKDQIDFHRVNTSVISVRIGRSMPTKIFQSSVSYKILEARDRDLFRLLKKPIRNFGEFEGSWVSPRGGKISKTEIISPGALRAFKNGCTLCQSIGISAFTPNLP